MNRTGELTGPLVELLTSDGRIPATNRRLTSRSTVFYRVKDGRIVEILNFVDNVQLFAQLGRLRLEVHADDEAT